MDTAFDLIGRILVNVFKFLDSNFDQTLAVHDVITHDDMTAEKMFFRTDDRWYLRPESLPGYPEICAIGIDKQALYLEAAPFSRQDFDNLVLEKSLSYRYDEAVKAIIDSTGMQVLTVSEPEKVKVEENDLPARCLCVLQLQNLTNGKRLDAIQLLDQMFAEGVFVIDDAEEVVSASSAGGIGVRLEMGMYLMQVLQMIQRPILSLQQRQAMVVVGAQVQIQQMLAFQNMILRLGPEARLAHVEKLLAEKGESAVTSMLSFVIAGRVKKARPELSWKDARRVARRMMTTRPAKS
ncbi:MAG: hypothetical protein KBB55_02020 [Candidatus Buchananbacteria bacterium]|nr:hypothetical protein [Candidatus Buchananbacteria bacterium]